MEVSTVAWATTVAITIAVLLFDVIIIARRPHEPSMRECSIAISIYISGALLFGLWVLFGYGTRYGGEFYVGWLTEYSLSIDNLFIFIIIMSRFSVPRKYQQEALMIGIILALIFRAIFIAAGAVAIETFSWVFYIFGAFLIYTAWTMISHKDDEYEENRIIGFAKRRLPATDEYDGIKLIVKRNGKRLITPMLIVMIALGSTDVMFALDSIPAIYGLTQEPYLVFTANVFALMGLRQLYFLLGGLLNRLVYLSHGLSAILVFIGIKLILHALHENELSFINGGEHVKVPEIPTWLSLVVILAALAITAVASLAKDRSEEKAAD